MSARADDVSGGPAPTVPPEGIMEKLEATLRQQVSRAREGDIDGVQALSDALAGLVSRVSDASRLGSPLPAASLNRIRGLWDELLLILGDRKDHLRSDLASIGRAKGALRAYRNSP